MTSISKLVPSGAIEPKRVSAKASNTFSRRFRKNPHYALAYAGMADSYIISAEGVFYRWTKRMPRFDGLVTKRFEVDETVADGHIMVATAREHDWNWTEAEREYRRAIELNPGLARAHHWYGLLFKWTKKNMTKAISELKRAVEI